MAKSLMGIFLIALLLSGLTLFSTISVVKAQAPEITIIQPENLTYASRDVPLTVHTNAPTRLWASLNGFNFTIEGNTTLRNLQNGDYTLKVFASTAGQVSTQTVQFTVQDNQQPTPPKVTILSPTNQIYNSSQITIDFTVDQQTYWALYSLDGYKNQTVFPHTIISLSNGQHTLTVYANGLGGGPSGSDSVTFTVNGTNWMPMPSSNINSGSNFGAAVDKIVQASMQAVKSEAFLVTVTVIFAVAIGVLIVFLVVLTKRSRSSQKKQGRMIR